MKYVKHTAIFCLLAILFVANVGINVFKHICSEDGVAISYIFDASDDHCGEEVMHADLPPCCQKEEQDSKEEDDCCSDEVEYYSMKVDAEVHNATPFSYPVIAQLTQHYYNIELPPVKQKEHRTTYVHPPPPDGREILLKKQVWII